MTVNFTNILRAVFSYQSSLRNLYVLTIWVSNFWRKDLGAKAAHKMLVKLTPAGVKPQIIEYMQREPGWDKLLA